jgi:DNA-directed RNA polymerase subunit RPC12/RpoP
VNDFDTDYTNDVICPYCGHHHTDDLHEFFSDRDWEDISIIECHSCEKEFHAERDITVHYSTSKKGA